MLKAVHTIERQVKGGKGMETIRPGTLFEANNAKQEAELVGNKSAKAVLKKDLPEVKAEAKAKAKPESVPDAVEQDTLPSHKGS